MGTNIFANELISSMYFFVFAQCVLCYGMFFYILSSNEWYCGDTKKFIENMSVLFNFAMNWTNENSLVALERAKKASK